MLQMLKYLETISKETHTNEEHIIAKAVEIGIRQMWRERILGKYLKKEISREEAIDIAGIDMVELAERQHKAMMEDLVWAMEK